MRILFELIEADTVRPLHLERSAARWIIDFLQRYEDLSPQIADASLMYLAERERITTIFTLDRRDFSVFRTSGGDALSLLPV